MPQLTQEQERATAVYQQLLESGVQCTLNLKTLEITPLTATSPQPAASPKPKAKTTPTKRKPKANKFYDEVIVGGYAARQKRQAWAATKGKNMKGVPQSVAERNGWSSSKTGKVTKKGKSAKPTATWA